MPDMAADKKDKKENVQTEQIIPQALSLSIEK